VGGYGLDLSAQGSDSNVLLRKQNNDFFFVFLKRQELLGHLSELILMGIFDALNKFRFSLLLPFDG
jgi:hypothetical protein